MNLADTLLTAAAWAARDGLPPLCTVHISTDGPHDGTSYDVRGQLAAGLPQWAALHAVLTTLDPDSFAYPSVHVDVNDDHAYAYARGASDGVLVEVMDRLRPESAAALVAAAARHDYEPDSTCFLLPAEILAELAAAEELEQVVNGSAHDEGAPLELEEATDAAEHEALEVEPERPELEQEAPAAV